MDNNRGPARDKIESVGDYRFPEQLSRAGNEDQALLTLLGVPPTLMAQTQASMERVS